VLVQRGDGSTETHLQTKVKQTDGWAWDGALRADEQRDLYGMRGEENSTRAQLVYEEKMVRGRHSVDG